MRPARLCPRFSSADIRREAISRGIVADIGGTIIWRWLHEDAIKPWTHRSWVFLRDPKFAAKAGAVLDLYEGRWRGKPLSDPDFVLCADEKPSIQARRRKHPTVAPTADQPMRVEHEYAREGACTYIAAWDVHRAKVFGRCVPGRESPTSTASSPRSWLDHPTTVRGECSGSWTMRPSIVAGAASTGSTSSHTSRVVHTPIHAGWINQVEVYFSIVQRKVLAPNDFPNLDQLQQRLLDFQPYYEQIARPFRWKFTRRDLANVLQHLPANEVRLGQAARDNSSPNFRSTVLTQVYQSGGH